MDTHSCDEMRRVEGWRIKKVSLREHTMLLVAAIPISVSVVLGVCRRYELAKPGVV